MNEIRLFPGAFLDEIDVFYDRGHYHVNRENLRNVIREHFYQFHIIESRILHDNFFRFYYANYGKSGYDPINHEFFEIPHLRWDADSKTWRVM